jgi:SPP1 family predicted phage head-tail adaptor
MTISTGELNRRVSLLSPASTTNDLGEPGPFTSYATVWAMYRPAKGREIQSSDRPINEVFDMFYIRYRADVSPTHRLVYSGNTYTIARISEIGNREFLEVFAKAVI